MQSFYDDDARQRFLSFFYERLGCHLLHAPLPTFEEWLERRGQTRFDLDMTELDTSCEFKGASNNDRLPIFLDQFEEQLAEVGFPLGFGLIWVFSYRNRSGRGLFGEQTRLLKKRGKTARDVSQFLAQNTTSAYVVDIRLLDALRRHQGTRPHLRDKVRERRLLKVNRRDLQRVAANVREELQELGITEVGGWLPHNASTIRCRIVETVIDDLPIKFKLFPILPIYRRSRFLKQLNGTVKCVV